MNDSIDLRKRILKMRQSNNIDLESVELKDSNNKDKNLINKSKDILKTDLNNFQNEKNIKNKYNDYFNPYNGNFGLNKKQQNNISYDAQFKLLANKFNEAVEVILELSDRVKKLENTVYLKGNNNKVKNENIKIPNLKIITFIVFSLTFILGIIYLPINFSILNLILGDISTLI